MRYTLIFILTIITAIFNYDSALGQFDTIYIPEIKTYVKYIDSLVYNDNSQDFIIKSISEGPIMLETKTIAIGKNNKMDTTIDIKNGGFSKYTYQNMRGDTVYKIEYHDNIDKNFYETYYFKENKLIFAKVEMQEDGIGQIFYWREVFYEGEIVLGKNLSTLPIEEKYKPRINFSTFNKGNEYLRIFLEDQHSR